MNRRMLTGLIVVNVVLLLMLILTATGPPASAQRLRGGDYVMIAGRTPGRTINTIYIADLNNDAVLAVTYNQTRKTLEPLGFRHVARDFQGGASNR